MTHPTPPLHAFHDPPYLIAPHPRKHSWAQISPFLWGPPQGLPFSGQACIRGNYNIYSFDTFSYFGVHSPNLVHYPTA